MKITICGSIAFFEQMKSVKQQLEAFGHIVEIPPLDIPDNNKATITVERFYELRKTETDPKSWIWDSKEKAMRCHFNKIGWSDAILVLNYDKRGIANYIGANTLIEMGIALHLNKKIYLLNAIPEISYKEEILGMKPIIICHDLNKIR